MVNHDRFGLFRPTANEKGEVINPDWRTYRNVHLDVSPLGQLDTSSLMPSFIADEPLGLHTAIWRECKRV